MYCCITQVRECILRSLTERLISLLGHGAEESGILGDWYTNSTGDQVNLESIIQLWDQRCQNSDQYELNQVLVIVADCCFSGRI